MAFKKELTALLALFLVIAALAYLFGNKLQDVPGPSDVMEQLAGGINLETYSSCESLKEKVDEQQSQTYYDRGVPNVLTAGTTAKSESAAPAADYSQTNVQVEGVDEADFVKNDGKYIYVLHDNRLDILDAYPAEEMNVVSKTELEDMNAREIFIKENKLVVFGEYYSQEKEIPVDKSAGIVPYDYIRSMPFTKILVYNIGDKSSPQLLKSYDFEGYYITSRMIESKVYLVLNAYPNTEVTNPEFIAPLYREDDDELKATVKCNEIQILDENSPVEFINIVAVDVDELSLQKEIAVGSAQNVYSSMANLFVAQTDYSYFVGCGGFAKCIAPPANEEKTNIFKFSLNEKNILGSQVVAYKGKTNVPGHILNQFSMDESGSYFRIATTSGDWDSQENNIYVIDKELNVVGKLEGIAPGERIYSTRFMGDRVYMVTYKQTDPFFVIDLSIPERPAILGYLKIPGFSNYLHPYDENHIIGIGKETFETDEGVALQEGMKLALFDVTDVGNPKQLHKEIIGDRGTDSEVLYDHKAFLFDKSRNLLVFPVSVAEIKNKKEEWTWGETVFQGAYVYDLTLYGGFQLRGKITHKSNTSSVYDYGDTIRRSLYMDNNLYTISNREVKANSLTDMSEISAAFYNEASRLNECLKEGKSVNDCCAEWVVENDVGVPLCGDFYWVIENDGCAIRFKGGAAPTCAAE